MKKTETFFIIILSGMLGVMLALGLYFSMHFFKAQVIDQSFVKNEMQVKKICLDQKIIDDVNILEATKLAMKVALYDLDIPYDYIFIDGPIKLKSIAATQCPIIKGDSKVLSIAAASIVAKVVRDHLMYEYDKNFPLYKWRKNKGYLTKDHREAIITYGPCEYHRKSFKGVKEYA